MRYRKLVMFIILAILTINTKIVQAYNFENNISFNRLTAQDGLSQITINDIFQDSEGYIWFATKDGLNKYDGVVFDIYKYGLSEGKSISYSSITCINEDRNKNLWVGTNKGINKINIETDEIEIYDTADSGLANLAITDILIDDKERVIVSTKDGIYIYIEENNYFERILYSDKEDIIISQEILEILQDYRGVYWIVTEGGINSYNEETEEIDVYTLENIQGLNIKNSCIVDIHIDDNNRMWIGTLHEGVIIIDPNSDDIIIHNHNPEDDNSLGSNYVNVIMEDSQNRIWIGTDSGLSLFDEESEIFYTYESKVHDTATLSNNNVLSIFEDALGIMWIGTTRGANMFNPDSIFKAYKNDPFDENSLNNNYIFGIYQDDEGFIWVGTNGSGVNIIDREKNEVIRLTEDFKNNNVYTNQFITDIDGIGDDIWFSTRNELLLIHKETRELTRFPEIEEEVREIYVDDKNQVWIGTIESLYRIDRDYNIIEYGGILESHGIEKVFVRAILKDTDGFLWIGLDGDGGLIKYDEENDVLRQYKYIETEENTLSYNSIKDIKEDSEGNIWIATDSGLNKYNEDEDNFTTFTEDDGLANNFVYGMLIDSNDNVWVSTNRGISKYNQREDRFLNFRVEDGLQGNEFNSNSYFKSDTGEMFFGGISGLNSFYPEEFIEVDRKTELIIDNVIVSGERVECTDEIILKYYDDKIEFELFLPDYRNSNEITYSYKLQGVDEDWQYENNNRTISYTDLESGEYVLLVSAKNSYGQWSNVIEINIKKNKAPWETEAAYLSYAITILFIIVSIFEKNKILNVLVNLRTDELNTKLIENSMVYKKKIDSEVNKNNYFVNLSHELRTPLNVILTTETLITTLNKKAENIPKDKLEYYMIILKKNSNRLLKLINDIIDTSKIESGTYELSIKEYDVVYHIEDVALSMKDYIEEKGIEFIIDPLVEEKTIECDINEIEKCVINLISNASKFTKEGGKIEVIIEEEDAYVKIKVRDSGIGISKRDIEKIFHRFGQASNRDDVIIKGSGIGLFLVKQIVELHNGELLVESEVGKGSEFIIKLPIKHTIKN